MFVPVARISCKRLFISPAAGYDMKVHQLNVTIAYLYGILEEKIFVNSPEDLAEILKRIIENSRNSSEGTKFKDKNIIEDLHDGHNVCLLKKSLYGLRQAVSVEL